MRPLVVAIAIAAFALAARAGGADAYDDVIAALGAQVEIELHEAAVEETAGMVAAPCVDPTRSAWIVAAPALTAADIASITVVERFPPVPGALEVRFTEAGAVKNRQLTTRLNGKWIGVTLNGKILTMITVKAPSDAASIVTTKMSEAQIAALCDAFTRTHPAHDGK
ncbi:MAG: hypothetical protein H0W83_09345 [Planctomycetes bacterium]|nr:hypothetical protein [Planctomycetota bacterium]